MAMSSSGSVSGWIAQLREGDQEAAQQLWERYFRRLVGLARGQLANGPKRMADEEDVALSAFASFCRRLEEGYFPRLTDRDELWSLLVTITQRKALALRKREHRQKRGGGHVRGDSALLLAEGAHGWAEVLSREPTPAFAAEMADQYRRLLGLLDSDEQRRIVQWKLEGYTNAEIAERLGCVVVTVERRLRLIRAIWQRELPPDPERERQSHRGGRPGFGPKTSRRKREDSGR
jgi:RNA polymerase sigma factor (sigma-70 family)